MPPNLVQKAKNSGIFCGYDPDSLITYTTARRVVIKDCFLGSTAYFVILVALCYSVGYVLIWEKGYLERVVPSGVSRLTLRAPNFIDIPESQLGYCRQYNSSAGVDCVFKPSQLYVKPPALGGQMFIATYVKEYTYDYSACNAFLDKNCPPPPEVLTNEYFSGGVENSTLFVDHTVQAETIEKSLMQMHGVLRSCHGRHGDVDIPARKKGETRNQYVGRTTFQLSSILQHAHTLDGCGLTLDDISPADTDNETFRVSGTVVVLYISYSNLRRTFQLPIEYTVEARILSGQKYKVEEQYEEGNGTVFFSNRHGLLINVVQTGEIGVFVLSGLFVQLAGALALVTVGTTITDLLARFVMRDRAIYNAAMFETTNDIDDIKAGAPIFERHIVHATATITNALNSTGEEGMVQDQSFRT